MTDLRRYNCRPFIITIIINIVQYQIFIQHSSHQVVAQSTPVIGGPCKLGSTDVNIGGKQTQFFLHCESNDASSNEGIWVVKSRLNKNESPSPSSTHQQQNNVQGSQQVQSNSYSNGQPQNQPQPQQQKTYSQLGVQYPDAQTYDLQQHPKKHAKLPSAPIICEQNLQAREGTLCNAPETCLQQNLAEIGSYLQCNPATQKWIKKYCQQGFVFNFEHQSCIGHPKTFRQHVARQPANNGGLVCTYSQCSQSNPCSSGTCNNGYCCSSSLPAQQAPLSIAGTIGHMHQFPGCPRCNQLFSYVCPNGAQPYGRCSGGSCATGYQCMPTTNLCCPTNPQPLYSACPGGGTAGGSCVGGQCGSGYACNNNNVCCAQVVPATVCPDGTQAAGACVNNMCGMGFLCNQGLCCTNTSQTPRCLDGSQAIGACMQGKCGTGYTCTTGNVCCPSTLNSCPAGTSSIGQCVNGRCPDGYTCINNQCCGPPLGAQGLITCDRSDSNGPCIDPGNTCPEPGYACDTQNNWCCPKITGAAVGPCITGAGGTRLCPEGYACSGPNVGQCFRLDTGTCAPEDQFGPCGAGDTCPPKYTCVGGVCCKDGSTRRRKRSFLEYI